MNSNTSVYTYQFLIFPRQLVSIFFKYTLIFRRHHCQRLVLGTRQIFISLFFSRFGFTFQVQIYHTIRQSRPIIAADTAFPGRIIPILACKRLCIADRSLIATFPDWSWITWETGFLQGIRIIQIPCISSLLSTNLSVPSSYCLLQFQVPKSFLFSSHQIGSLQIFLLLLCIRPFFFMLALALLDAKFYGFIVFFHIDLIGESRMRFI